MYTIEQILQTGKDCELSMIDIRYLAERLAEKYSDTAATPKWKDDLFKLIENWDAEKHPDKYDKIESFVQKLIAAPTEQFILRTFDSNKWYWCKCENCGWEDSSELCAGGNAIADTGDFSDPLCPICFSDKIEGEPTISVPDKEGLVNVKIPLETYMLPYAKELERLRKIEDDIRYPSIGNLYHAPQPEVKPEPVNDWVSVEDGLPEYYKTVQVFDKGLRTSYNAWRASNGDDDYYTVTNSDFILPNPTHWQTLPTPPQPTKEQ